MPELVHLKPSSQVPLPSRALVQSLGWCVPNTVLLGRAACHYPEHTHVYVTHIVAVASNSDVSQHDMLPGDTVRSYDLDFPPACTNTHKHTHLLTVTNTFTLTQLCTPIDTVAHISSCMHIYTDTYDTYKNTI